jgi:RimJ/RimL family protein N-acetyltransferase
MNHLLGSVSLRKLEPRDIEALYTFKNDPEVATLLGGFSTGYAERDLAEWLEYHRKRADEVLWTIASADTDECLGHVGLYRIDHRVRSAEFAIMLGHKPSWGQGLGKRVSAFVIDYGFDWLNLNRLELEVLASNKRAIALYEALGFRREGVKRQAQFKAGGYVDVILMAVLREEWGAPGA